jgi:D-alanyl-lipoteichoic acid acyltransferase DltB (MBOAT superfamily)
VLASYAYAIQLYSDFAGVTNLAIGIGLLFGIEAPPNFERPFYAPNIQEFWRRWHMTLTGWLTDYLFTPLRLALRDRGDLGLAIAIAVNMVVIGAWHGASWSYVAFGVINAVFMIVSAFTLKRRNRFYKSRPRLSAWRRVTGPLLTFHLVVFAFIFLRDPTVREGLSVATHLLPLDLLAAAREGRGIETFVASLRGLGLAFDHIAWAVVAIPLMELVELWRRDDVWQRRFAAMPRWLRWSGYYATTLGIVFMGVLETREFIYAHF